MKARHAAVAALALLVEMGCAAAGPGAGASRPERATVTVMVRNDNFYGANIHALYQGLTRHRLGYVEGFTTDTFALAWHPSRLQMQMSLVGVGTTYSDILTVEPGDVLELVLLPDLHRKVIRRRG